MTPAPRRIAVVVAVLASLTVVSFVLLMRPAPALEPVRGAPRFELDEPPATLDGSIPAP